jgi:hypothetical protein
MSSKSENEEAVETPQAKKPKITLIVALSITVGILLACSIGISIIHFQSGKGQAAELISLKDELKRKTQLVNDSQEQVANLSKQIHALREFSVSRAQAVAAATIQQADQAARPPAPAEPEEKKPEPISLPITKKSKSPQPAAAVEKSEPSAAIAVEPEAVKAKTASAPPAKKTAPATQDCQLVGKSAEEQAATLRRCMQSVDGRR